MIPALSLLGSILGPVATAASTAVTPAQTPAAHWRQFRPGVDRRVGARCR